MKNYNKIVEEISNMRWSIDDPEPTSFGDIQFNVKQAVQQAHSYIWGRSDFPFKRVAEKIVLPEGQNSFAAPAGNIINILAQGNQDYMKFESQPDFLQAQTGTPKRYWIEFYNTGNVLNFHPRADKSYFIQIRYDTIYKARNKNGELIFNLDAADDVLNLPPEFEEVYLSALKPMAMYYLIADNTDENFQPYWEQFEHQYANLKALTGSKIETRFIL